MSAPVGRDPADTESEEPRSGETAAELRVDPAVVAERVGDGAVVVHLETNQILELNATAARLFELLRGGATRAEIEATLLAEYDVEPETLRRQLDELLARLRERRVVR
jgi:PqqD family protein of HPr-rel-A system